MSNQRVQRKLKKAMLSKFMFSISLPNACSKEPVYKLINTDAVEPVRVRLTGVSRLCASAEFL